MHSSNITLIQLLKTVYIRAPERLEDIFYRHGVNPDDANISWLVTEICYDGANSIASIFRKGDGVPYSTIVRDVAGKLKLRVNTTDDEISLEQKCLEAVIQKYLDSASSEVQQRIQEIIRESGQSVGNWELFKQGLMNGFRIGTLGLLIKEIGLRATSQIVKRIVFVILGEAAALQAGIRAAQIAGFAIPLLNIIMIGWTIVDLAGPAFRKTIPTVLEIALLRMEFGSDSKGSHAKTRNVLNTQGSEQLNHINNKEKLQEG